MKRRDNKKTSSKDGVFYCDWQGNPLTSDKINVKSVIYRHKSGSYTWRGIKTETYKPGQGDWHSIIRRTLIGNELKSKSHVRYFEIAPGGQSSFEKHRHEHIVIGIRGTGRVSLDNKQHMVKIFDVIYVSPNTPHCFSNPSDEPFGFLCIVSAKRDKPKILSKK
ncbi:MAG: cupin domain-containing protein [Nitrospiraceae bacterium]|nr:MAG: cupin domain-containing protein [Nitrospiraceae bacterium]